MSVIFIIGPPAAGKMTIGQDLERRIAYRLFHNHVAIEVVAPYFSYGTQKGRSLVAQIRQAFFDAFAADTESGYIFTFVWAFGEPGEREYIEGVAEQFRSAGHRIYWVELETAFNERLKRNRGANRLAHKPTKRDIAWSESHIRDVEQQYRFNSLPGELGYTNYLRIDNTNLSASDVSNRICEFFGFE